VGPRAGLDAVVRRKKFLPLQAIKPWSSSPLPSHCTAELCWLTLALGYKCKLYGNRFSHAFKLQVAFAMAICGKECPI